jgi:hypothetical protein
MRTENRARKAAEREIRRPLIATYRRPMLGSWLKWLLVLGLMAISVVNGYWFAVYAPHLMLPFAIPPVLLALFLIWALPHGDYAPTRPMTGLFWGFLIAFVAWPNYLAIALPGLPWLTFLRITAGPMAVLLLVSVSVSAKFRREVSTVLKDSPLMWKSLIAYLIVVTLTLPFSGHIGDTINRYIVLLLDEVAVFFICCHVFAKRGAIELWAYALLALNMIVCLLGVWEMHLGVVPWAGHIPSFLQIEDPTVVKILTGGARAATGVHRVASVATTALNLAEILGLTTPFALHIAVHRYPLVIRAFAAAMLPLLVYVIILTDARLGFMAMLVSGTLYVLLISLVRWREARSSILGPAVVLSYPAIFLAIVAATLFIGKIRAKVWGDGSQNASNEARKAQWRMATPKIIKDPIGHGYGEGGRVLGYHNSAGIGSIDSYYLNLMLETGIVGFILYLVLFLGASGTAAKTLIQHPMAEREERMLMPMSVCLVAFIVVKSVLSEDANHPLVFMVLAGIATLVHRIRQQEREAPGSVSAPSA